MNPDFVPCDEWGVYVSRYAQRVARVHNNNCPDSNGGIGKGGGTQPKSGGWYGPYPTRQDAWQAAQQLAAQYHVTPVFHDHCC